MKPIANNNGSTKRRSLFTKLAFGGMAVMLTGATLGFAGSAASAIPDDGNRGQEGNVGAPSDPSDHSSDDNQDERDRKAKEEANKPKPPAKPSPTPSSEDKVAEVTIVNPVPGVTYDGSTNTFRGDIVDLIKSYGDRPSNPPAANDPIRGTVKSATGSKTCDFRSGTTNLDDTKKMFRDKGCGSWSPYLHKCDYSSEGWHCYSQ